MFKITKQKQVAGAGNCSAMEQRPFQKRVSPKNHKSRRHFKMLIILIFGFLCFSTNIANAQTKKTYYNYTVKKGESLYTISKETGVSVDEILAANPNAENGLRVEQTLFILIENSARTSTNQQTIQTTSVNQQSTNRANFITSVIPPKARFTNTFVEITGRGYYVISYKNGNLYYREYKRITIYNLGRNEYDLVKEQFILADVREIYGGNGNSYFAIKNDGTLWAWGSNYKGQLGDNTGIDKTTPVKILDDVKDIMFVSWSVYALKNDGTVYAWGENQLENRYAPEKLPINNILFFEKDNLPYHLDIAVASSGNQYSLRSYGKIELAGKYDKNVCFKTMKDDEYKLTPNGELYKDNVLFASNIAYINRDRRTSYEMSSSCITKNGELYNGSSNRRWH